MTEPSVAEPRPTLAALFAGFATISIIAFGGVLPWTRWVLVERRRWLTDPQFTDLFAFCQLFPGPNVINMAVVLGDRFRGPLGSLAAFFGMVSPAFAIYVTAGLLYEQYGRNFAALDRAINGMALVVAGLVIATGIKMARAQWRSPPAVIVMAMVFVAIGVLWLPMVWVLVVMAPLSIAVAHLTRRGA